MNGFIVTDFNQKERKKEKPFCRSKSETIFPLNRWHRRATLKNWVAIKIAFVPMPTNDSKINNSRNEERGEKKTKHIYMRINNILRSDSNAGVHIHLIFIIIFASLSRIFLFPILFDPKSIGPSNEMCLRRRRRRRCCCYFYPFFHLAPWEKFIARTLVSVGPILALSRRTSMACIYLYRKYCIFIVNAKPPSCLQLDMDGTAIEEHRCDRKIIDKYKYIYVHRARIKWYVLLTRIL